MTMSLDFAHSLPQSSPSKPLRSKSSASSLREAAATPLSRLRNKFFAVKATHHAHGEVDVEISHTSSPSEDNFLSPPTHRGLRLKGSSPSLHKERSDEYLRQALQSASVKRSNTLPFTPYPTNTPPISTSKPLPPSPINAQKTSNAATRHADNIEPCSPRFILAVDPDWEPSSGDATLFIFPQDKEDLQGDVDCVTLEEIWNGFFPGLDIGSAFGK